MTEPGEDTTAAAGGRGHLRASRLDRERVIELLKVAFTQDRLTKDELDARVGQALASRTYSDLAGLTADLPADLAPAGPEAAGPAAAKHAAEPAGSPARTLAKAARRSVICLLVPLAVLGVAALTHSQDLLGLAVLLGILALVAVPGFLGYGVVDAWQERRSRGQLPPQAGRDVRELEDGARHHPARPGGRTDQTRAELRTDSSRAGRPRPSGRGTRVPGGVRPVPGVV
jgi:hypothetical protein